MGNQNIVPEKITKPIQLLGAWLAGLFSIDSCFLIAAAKMNEGSWESMALVIAAIVNVPLFLIAVFLLQTKFRPELQEDSYYSTYLSQKTNEPRKITKHDSQFNELRNLIENLEQRISSSSTTTNVELNNSELNSLLFGVNRFLPEKEMLKKKMAELGLIRSTTFGGSEAPKQKNVSISQHIPEKMLPDVIRLIGELGFDGYNFYDPLEENAKEDVLLGSYGTPEYEILKKTA